MQLHIISWNACGIKTYPKLASLKTYVGRHHPHVIFIQEAFVGCHVPGEDAPPLPGFVSYVHHVRNGLVSYIHSSIPHQLLRCSTDDDMTFQLFEITVGDGKLRLCNVYSAPGRINLPALPTVTSPGMIYMGDFNARHPALGDVSPIPNRSGLPLLEYIRRHRLTHWPTGGATHTRGGTLDHIITSGLVASHVKCFPIQTLFSDHVALGLQYSLSSGPSLPHTRLRITIPPKYCPTYISYISSLLPTFDFQSPENLYSSLVGSTHDFYTRYVTRPHVKGYHKAHAWTLNHRILQAERKAVEDGLAFQRQPTSARLLQYQASRDDLVALQQCAHTEAWRKYIDGINHQTSVGSMWHMINRVIKKKPPSALHHSPAQYAQDLINTWSEQARACNLPTHVQEALSTNRNVRTLRLMAALLREDEDDDVPITEDELRRALARSKATAPGDDGVTYQVLCLLLKVPGNPLLQLYNLCFSRGYVPRAWTSSTIVPIPKPGTNKFRPISLTSCFSKVLERIFLTRLMFRVQDKLSPRLYGFLPQRSTHHCLMELYARLSPTSVVAFLDLKSAFDVANREVILDQLVEYGVQGNLLRWIRGYLSNRTSRVLFKGACSTSKELELGTPQGRVLSPFLFNVLMHGLLTLLPDIPGTTVTCYADDICVHSTSAADLQRFLQSFHESSSACGFILSPDKSRVFSPRGPRTLPVFTAGHSVIPPCTQYLYLGAPVRITPAIPARQRVHPIIQDLLHRLDQRFVPFKWLTNNAAGISIPLARTIYIAFIRSVIDYLSPALSQLSKTSLQPLEKFQNKVMRYILGCPTSTRIVNMLTELNLPSVVERIHANVSCLSVKCLHSPHLAPHYSHVLRASLDPATPRPPLRPGVRTLVSTVCSTLHRLHLDIPVAEVDHGPPPWRIPQPHVTFTPTSKTDPPLLQKQLALQHIATLSSSVPAARHLYADGSVQSNGGAGCAVYSPDIDPPEGGWLGRRLPNASSSTYCELQALLLAVTLLCQRRLNGVVMCDSQSALQAISSPQPTHRSLIHQILHQLVAAQEHSLCLRFLWIPSHVGIDANDRVDLLAKSACELPLPDGATPSLSSYKRAIHSAALLPTLHRMDAERGQSVSIQHYDHFRLSPPRYRQHGLMVRRHNIVCARLRLGYRPLWQVSEAGDIPHLSTCRLCDRPNANSLHHYCLECPSVRDLLPRGQDLVPVCQFLLADNNLDTVLVRHPHFGGC